MNVFRKIPATWREEGGGRWEEGGEGGELISMLLKNETLIHTSICTHTDTDINGCMHCHCHIYWHLHTQHGWTLIQTLIDARTVTESHSLPITEQH